MLHLPILGSHSPGSFSVQILSPPFESSGGAGLLPPFESGIPGNFIFGAILSPPFESGCPGNLIYGAIPIGGGY